MTATIPAAAPSAHSDLPCSQQHVRVRRIVGALVGVLGVIVGGPLGMVGTVWTVIVVLRSMGEVGIGGGLFAVLFSGTGLAAGSFAGWVLAEGLVARPLVGRPIPLLRLALLGIVVPVMFAFLAPVMFLVLAGVLGSVLR